MTIEYLVLKNFRSFSNKETKITLKDKFNIFVGKNGSGKSTILLAIRYALFGTQGLSIKNDELVNNINKDGMKVELKCYKEGNEIVIQRGREKKQSFVRLFINGNELDLPSIKEYDKKIEELVGFNYKLFDYFSINSQIFTKNFFKMTKKERDVFIRKVLGIEDFYMLMEKLKKVRKKYENELEVLEKEKTVLENLLKDKKERISSLKERLGTDGNLNGKAITEEIRRTEKSLKEAKREYASLNERMKKENEKKEIKSKIQQIDVFIKEIENELKTIKETETIDEIERKISVLKKKIEKQEELRKKEEKLKAAKRRFFQKYLALKEKKKKYLLNARKNEKALAALKEKGTYLNRITKGGDIKTFVEKNGDGIIKFLFFADEKFFFEKEKPFSKAKIDFSSSKIMDRYKEFKDMILNSASFTTAITEIDKESEELLDKYKTYIKSLLKEIKSFKKEIEAGRDYSEEITLLLEKKSISQKRTELLKKRMNLLEQRKYLTDRIEKIKANTKEAENIYTLLDKKVKEIEDLNKKLSLLKNQELILQTLEKEEKEMNAIKEKINGNKEESGKILEKIRKADEMIKKDGVNAVKKTVEDFLKIFNFYIKKYLKDFQIRFDVQIKGDFSFIIKERGRIIDYNILSKGEETILNLILILGLNETLKTMSNIKFNLLIFDEIDGTLDDENLMLVLEKLVSLGKDILFVSHRKEIFDMERKNIEVYRIKKEIFSKIESL